jgi:hypothetical protein
MAEAIEKIIYWCYTNFISGTPKDKSDGKPVLLFRATITKVRPA